jgi:hypothetical protein
MKIQAYRWWLGLALGVLIALGLGSKAYSGWGSGWVNRFGGDVLYVMFWIGLVGWLQPRWAVWRITLVVTLATCAIEFSQLITVPTEWTDQLWWRLLLGVHFSWWDFPHYGLGAVLGGLGLAGLQRYFGVKRFRG